MRGSRLVVAVVVVALGFAPASASAGRNHFGWLFDNEVNEERGVELETWLFEEDGTGDAGIEESSLWWGPTIGVTDQLELAIPVEVLWIDVHDGSPPRTKLSRFGAEVRWRLVTMDPEEAPPVAPLLRLAVKRMIDVREGVRIEGDVVVGLDAGRVHAAVDLGAVTEIVDGADSVELYPAAGVSVAVTDDLSVGVEAIAEIVAEGEEDSWVAVGPDLAWTHGRFWLSAAYGIGVYQIDAAPRLNWGVAF